MRSFTASSTFRATTFTLHKRFQRFPRLPDTSATRHFGPARDTSALVPLRHRIEEKSGHFGHRTIPTRHSSTGDSAETWCQSVRALRHQVSAPCTAPILWCQTVLWPKCPVLVQWLRISTSSRTVDDHTHSKGCGQYEMTIAYSVQYNWSMVSGHLLYVQRM